MRALLFFLLFAILCNMGCTHGGSKQVVVNKEPIPKIDTVVTVKDSFLYDAGFIEELRHSGISGKYIVRDGMIFMDNDTVALPHYIFMGETAYYNINYGDTAYNLALTCMNYTSLKFKIKIRDLKGILFEQEGVVHLSTGFMFPTTAHPYHIQYCEAEYSLLMDSNYLSVCLGREENGIDLADLKTGPLGDADWHAYLKRTY